MDDRASDSESACLQKLQREALICLNTFPGKVMELNSVIDNYTPEAIKKSRGNVGQKMAPGCGSIDSGTRDCFLYRDVGSCYSGTTLGRARSWNGISKRKYRLGYYGPTLRRRSRPLAQILTTLVTRLSVCTRAMVIKPSKYIMDIIAATFLQRRQLLRNVHGGSSAPWDSTIRTEATAVTDLICMMRPAAVRFITDTAILKRWLQALALASTVQSPSLAQAIRTTETIDVWAYELFFHLKYLQVMNLPCETKSEMDVRKVSVEFQSGKVEAGEMVFPVNSPDAETADDLTRTNLWHRIVQLRDNYVILYETLSNNDQLLDPNASE